MTNILLTSLWITKINVRVWNSCQAIGVIGHGFDSHSNHQKCGKNKRRWQCYIAEMLISLPDTRWPLVQSLSLLAFDCNDSGQPNVITWNILEAIWCQAVNSNISATWHTFLLAGCCIHMDFPTIFFLKATQLGIPFKITIVHIRYSFLAIFLLSISNMCITLTLM